MIFLRNLMKATEWRLSSNFYHYFSLFRNQYFFCLFCFQGAESKIVEKTHHNLHPYLDASETEDGIQIKCHAVENMIGNYKYKVSWTDENGAQVPLRNKSQNDVEDRGVLVYIKPIKTKDGERWACVSNVIGIGKDSTAINIIVTGKKKSLKKSKVFKMNFFFFKEKTKFEETESTIEVIEGEIITLPCEPNGSPSPRISWFFEDAPIDDNADVYKITKDGLDILNVVREKSGNYTCRANQSSKFLKSKTEKKFKLIVKCEF